MRTVKITIKSLFGISAQELGDRSVEIKGKKGVGKTSVIDAIRFALTHRTERDWIIKDGANEGEIIIETDSGLMIDRKVRSGKADYIAVKDNRTTVTKPESFLNTIVTPLQLNPVEFTQMSKADQNRAILDLIEFDRISTAKSVTSSHLFRILQRTFPTDIKPKNGAITTFPLSIPS